MVTAARVGPRWIDPDRVWAGSGPGSAALADEKVASEDFQIDRFHNHENMSPEALAQAVAQLQASLAAMTDRVATLEAAEESTLKATRRLGMDVIELAGALARRVRALEQPNVAPEPTTSEADVVVEEPTAPETPPASQVDAPAPLDVPADPAPPFLFVPQPAPRKKPGNGLAIALGFLVALTLAVAAAAGGLWYYRSQGHSLQPTRKPIATAPIKPVISAPQTRPPTVAPRKSSNAEARRSSPSKHEFGEAGAAASAAPAGHLLYSVGPTPAPAGSQTASGLAPQKP